MTRATSASRQSGAAGSGEGQRVVGGQAAAAQARSGRPGSAAARPVPAAGSSARPQYRPEPAMITGRSASRSRAAARASSASSARGPCVGRPVSPGARAASVAPAGAGASASPNTRSSGKSRNTGPVWGVSAVRIARSSSSGISAVCRGVAASLVRGATNGTWSSSCSEPWPQRKAGARPPSTSTGEWFSFADAIALIPLVTPGPAVSAHTPRVRVTLAQPSAAKAAVCSWRTSTMSMPSARHPS